MNASTTNLNFANADAIVYEHPSEEAAHAAKNANFCQQINAGQEFGVVFNNSLTFIRPGEEGPVKIGSSEWYYAFVVTKDGAMPMPVFWQALGGDPEKDWPKEPEVFDSGYRVETPQLSQEEFETWLKTQLPYPEKYAGLAHGFNWSNTEDRHDVFNWSRQNAFGM